MISASILRAVMLLSRLELDSVEKLDGLVDRYRGQLSNIFAADSDRQAFFL